jgi:ribosomal-protein-alanine N-acetyltransferase
VDIVTPRFLLRDFVDADLAAFLAYYADPRYLAFSGPDASSPERAEGLFEAFRVWACESPRLNYQLAIVLRDAPGALIGCAGLRKSDRSAVRADFGIELAPDYWGRHGYAIEIARTLLVFGFGELGLDEVHGVTVSANRRVARLADWLGAESVGTRPGPDWMSAYGWTETEWRITREHWDRRASVNR